MTDSQLKKAVRDLNETQRSAALWKEGALLVLAGPGSGKTQVLTCRIASLLTEGESESFRILALTFTTKAADEMKERVSNFAPGLEERALISTFHGFCGQVLRQHGIHIGIEPSFAIYSLEEDRKAILLDALSTARKAGFDVEEDGTKVLNLIDRLKARLIRPEGAEAVLARLPNRSQIATVYKFYEDELRKNNALDFGSLILEVYQLFEKFPAIAARYRRSHPYWLIDEFQDTNDAQYRLLRVMAGDQFKNIFAVADDDQIIYQWNGASYRQIQRLRADFLAEVIQLPTNYRCPPTIVDAANKLVSHNTQRTESKSPLVAGKSVLRLPDNQQIQTRVFEDSQAEAIGIASEIAERGPESWGSITVLARTRALLEGVLSALNSLEVPAVISQRRDDFLSAEIRFLVSCLKQVCRPLDRRNMTSLIDSFNRISGSGISVTEVMVEAEAVGDSFISSWFRAVNILELSPNAQSLKETAQRIFSHPQLAKNTVDEALDQFAAASPKDEQRSADLREDIAVWKNLTRDIGRHLGSGAPLDQFLQELQLRSKEPPAPTNSVALMTVHASKGREFDTVYLIGLAEDILPSYQSRLKGSDSAEMEEERRNCFVAITRTKELLILSRAKRYRGWKKDPSRFLEEMGIPSE